MPRSAEAKRRNVLRRARLAGGPRGITGKPPLSSGRPDPRNFKTVNPDTYSFPGYFTAEYLQAARPWAKAASPLRREGPSSPLLPSPTLPAVPKTGQEQVAPAPCTTCPTAGPQEPLDEEELILSSWRNKLILRRPPTLPVTQSTAIRPRNPPPPRPPYEGSKIFHHPALRALSVRSGSKSWKPCILSGPGVEACVYWKNPHRAAPTLVTRTADELKVITPGGRQRLDSLLNQISYPAILVDFRTK